MEKEQKIFCFSRGTKVLLSNQETKNIEDIKVHDEILSYNTVKGCIENIIVERTADSIHSLVNRIQFLNGISLVSTTDHPYFIVGKGWCSVNPKCTNENYNMKVGELNKGDKCLYNNKGKIEEAQITRIDTFVEDAKMHIISGGHNNSFFANGIVVSDENIGNLEVINQAFELSINKSL